MREIRAWLDEHADHPIAMISEGETSGDDEAADAEVVGPGPRRVPTGGSRPAGTCRTLAPNGCSRSATGSALAPLPPVEESEGLSDEGRFPLQYAVRALDLDRHPQGHLQAGRYWGDRRHLDAGADPAADRHGRGKRTLLEP